MIRVAYFLMWLAHFLPPRVLAAASEMFGAAAFWLVRERRLVVRVNLAKCFPNMDAAAREALARAHFRAFSRALFERSVLWWGSRERIEQMVRVEGLAHLRALEGAPAILFVPHFIGFDAGATRLMMDVNLTGLYARQKDKVLEKLLERGRTRFGDQRPFSRQDGIRSVLKWMRKGWPLFYLPDQDYGPRDAIFVPFFGVPAATVPGLTRIARITGAKVLPCVTRMLPGGRYVLEIEPPWDNFPSGDAFADTRRMNEYIERRALEMPEQYHWMHKRFKTRPPGEPYFYER